jgi:hypothetical protein
MKTLQRRQTSSRETRWRPQSRSRLSWRIWIPWPLLSLSLCLALMLAPRRRAGRRHIACDGGALADRTRAPSPAMVTSVIGARHRRAVTAVVHGWRAVMVWVRSVVAGAALVVAAVWCWGSWRIAWVVQRIRLWCTGLGEWTRVDIRIRTSLLRLLGLSGMKRCRWRVWRGIAASCAAERVLRVSRIHDCGMYRDGDHLDLTYSRCLTDRLMVLSG